MAISARQSGTRETIASVGVLTAVVAVGAWFWMKQAQFSPAVTVGATAAEAAAAKPATPGTDAVAGTLLATLPRELKTMGAVEVFTPQSLSDKIDGKAELYLSAGFAGMKCQRLAPTARPTAWFEAFIYEMTTPENAFAVYSSQKRTATQEVGVGDYSYRAGNQLCLVHGQYYVELVGAEDSEATLAAASDLARAFVSTTTVAKHANMAKDEALFPTEGMVPGSVMLLAADVFGFDQLTNTYVARYTEGADTITVFITRRPDAADATKLAAAVRGFFVNDCGGTETPAPASPKGAVVVDSGGSFDAVFATGPLVAGVHQAPSRDSAVRWLQRLGGRLQPANP